jgi:hypothetical protein
VLPLAETLNNTMSFTPEFFTPSESRNPYYIVAPGYSRYSAGGRVLYLLCHLLNSTGQTAFMHAKNTNHELNAPRLTRKIVEYHYSGGRTPIVVYPEVIRGNPNNADFIVRYIMNFFFSRTATDSGANTPEYILTYSDELKHAFPANSRVLSVPTSDTCVFNRTGESPIRQKECYYLNKRLVSKAPLKTPPCEHWIQIPNGNDKKNAMSREEMANLFRQSKALYLYEVSTLAIDAMLCGCPVVVMEDDLETEWITVKQIDYDGIARNTASEEYERAKATVGKTYENYKRWSEAVGPDLKLFVDETQQLVRAVPYNNKFNFDSLMNPPPLSLGRRLFGAVQRYQPRLTERIRDWFE